MGRRGDGEMGTRMKQIRFGGALIVTDFYTEMLRGFLKWMVLREIHRDRSFWTLHFFQVSGFKFQVSGFRFF